MLLKNGNLIIGDGNYKEGFDIRISDGRIAEVGRSLDTSKGDTVIDLTGRWVLPGLIDAHVHVALSGTTDPYRILSLSDADVTVEAVNNVKRLLRAGFTTARDVGGRNGINISVKKAIKEERIEGPRLLVAGSFITMTGGHGWRYGRQADGEIECRKAAREQIFNGADLLKVMATGGVSDVDTGGSPENAQLSEKEIAAVVEEAKKARKRVAAHCHGLDGIRNAVNAGVTSVEHGSFADRKTLELMKERGVYLCICIRATYQEANATGIPPNVASWAQKVLKSQLETLRMAHELGVKVVFGTDAGTPMNPHGENGSEFPFLLRGGLSEMEAIQAATKTASELLGCSEDIGTLEEEKAADIIVVRNNPLDDIRVLKRPHEELQIVIKGGKLVQERGTVDP